MDTVIATTPLFDIDAYRKNADARVLALDAQTMLLSAGVFYPVGGGQPGDTGALDIQGQSYQVLGTYRGQEHPDQIWLQLDREPEKTCLGKVASMSLDWDRRYRHMQMHTCLHLLCGLIDAPVMGCSIGANISRIDFDLPTSGITSAGVTEALNQLIQQNHSVRAFAVSQESVSVGAARSSVVRPPSFGDSVRVIEIPGVDRQACVGTHVRNTGEIAPVVCSQIRQVSTTNRRLEITWAGQCAEVA